MQYYNPEKPFNRKIMEEIQKTWDSSISVVSGYPIIKDKDLFHIEHVDGVGTKGYLHWIAGSYSHASIDAFAMNANDLAILGFTPKSMNCHLIIQEEKEDIIFEVVKKLSELCSKYNILYTGGETAILNTVQGIEIGLHMSGTTKKLINKEINAGDLIYGHPSTGIHSNGLTLARKLLNGSMTNTILEELTHPTAVYLDVLEKTNFAKKRMHITGGAFTKLLKLTKDNLNLIIDLSEINPPKIFERLYNNLNNEIDNPSHEMLRHFNCGIGFIEIIDPVDKERFEKCAPNANLIGRVVTAHEKVISILSPFDESIISFRE